MNDLRPLVLKGEEKANPIIRTKATRGLSLGTAAGVFWPILQPLEALNTSHLRKFSNHRGTAFMHHVVGSRNAAELDWDRAPCS